MQVAQRWQTLLFYSLEQTSLSLYPFITPMGVQTWMDNSTLRAWLQGQQWWSRFLFRCIIGNKSMIWLGLFEYNYMPSWIQLYWIEGLQWRHHGGHIGGKWRNVMADVTSCARRRAWKFCLVTSYHDIDAMTFSTTYPQYCWYPIGGGRTWWIYAIWSSFGGYFYWN